MIGRLNQVAGAAPDLTAAARFRAMLGTKVSALIKLEEAE